MSSNDNVIIDAKWIDGKPTEKGYYWLWINRDGDQYYSYLLNFSEKIFAYVGYEEYVDELQFFYKFDPSFQYIGNWHSLDKVVKYIKVNEPENPK